MRKLMIVFAAGCLGALANSLTVWAFGHYGISADLHVHIAPELSPPWLYPRIVWGGIWGLLFILPVLQSRWVLKGAVLSLAPTAVQLFVIFPFIAQRGMAGLELGTLTPLLVLFYNGVWGIVTAMAIRFGR